LAFPLSPISVGLVSPAKLFDYDTAILGIAPLKMIASNDNPGKASGNGIMTISAKYVTSWPFLSLLIALTLMGYYLLGLFQTVSVKSTEWIPDDAFITYRYSQHLAEGSGFRFNRSDEEKTQGFSSLSHMVAISWLSELGLDFKVGSRLLSILSLWLIPLVIGVLLARTVKTPVGEGVVVCLLIQLILLHLYPYFSSSTERHLLSGMETLFYMLSMACLCSVSVYEVFHHEEFRPSTLFRILLLLAALSFPFLTRPEGVILSAITLVMIPTIRWFILQDRSTLYDPLFRWALPLSVVGSIGFTLWKLHEFGYLLPNPFYVKSRHSVMVSEMDFLPGMKFTLSFLKVLSIPCLLTGIALAVTPIGGRRKVACILLCSPGVFLILSYVGAIHEMAFNYRYEFPYIIYIEVAGGFASICSLAHFHKAIHWPRWGLVLCAGGLLITIWRPGTILPETIFKFASDTSESTQGTFADIGKDLRCTGLGEKAVLVTGAAGMIPFFSGYRTIDLWGLNTNELSGRKPMKPSGIWEFVSQSSPDVVFSTLPPASPGVSTPEADPVMQSKAVLRYLSAVDGRIELFLHWDRAKMIDVFYHEMTYIRDHCVFGACYSSPNQDYWFILYVCRDSPYLKEILNCLRSSTQTDLVSDLRSVFTNDPRSLAPGL
jgi:arabinofuranosyltransferase